MRNKQSTGSQKDVRHRLMRWLVVVALLFGLLVGGAAGRFLLQDQASEEFSAQRRHLSEQIQQSHVNLDTSRARVAALEGQLMVEESTRKGLESSLQAAQAELGQALDQLAFFDQLLPPGPQGSISIRAFDIERMGTALQYRVLLMRNSTDDTMFNGLMQFMAKGSLLGKTVKIPLQPAQRPGNGELLPASSAPMAQANALGVSFEQFQRSGGLLSLPEGFKPDTITLNILEGNTVRVSRTVNLPAAE
jgi:cell division protein FtsB